MSEDRDRFDANDEEVQDEDVEAHRLNASAEESVDGDDDVEAHRHKTRHKT